MLSLCNGIESHKVSWLSVIYNTDLVIRSAIYSTLVLHECVDYSEPINCSVGRMAIVDSERAYTKGMKFSFLKRAVN
jgi:hypothetical protein